MLATMDEDFPINPKYSEVFFPNRVSVREYMSL